MKKLIRCAMCNQIIKQNELKKPNQHNETYCTNCNTFLNQFIKQWGENICP